MMYVDHNQWKVTSAGMEGAGYYDIGKDRLTAKRDGLYEWPIQLCTKSWIGFEDFIIAFEAALELHHGGYDEALMEKTIAKCRLRIAESIEFDEVCRDLFPERFTGNLHAFFVSEFDEVSNEIARRRAVKAAA